ncbi:hypothetical protein GCM10020221_33690 [Streptomyces thioluteus]|uniref:Uncharacterized protein n=1 Tax=Streptomyces thioluteus TaxID=66431 RepID=A0ABN3X569_STRTU
MLLGQHLGGGEHRRLASRVHHTEHGAQGDHRLPAADFALEQAVHGVFGGQVVEDLGGDRALAVGEGEGQPGVEGVEEAVGHGLAGHGGQLGVGVPAAGQGDLEDERLVPLQPVPGGLDVGLGTRAVDLAEGVRQLGQAPALAQRGRQRIDEALPAVGLEVGQQHVHGLADLPGLDLLAGGVERQRPARETPPRRRPRCRGPAARSRGGAAGGRG